MASCGGMLSVARRRWMDDGGGGRNDGWFELILQVLAGVSLI